MILLLSALGAALAAPGDEATAPTESPPADAPASPPATPPADPPATPPAPPTDAAPVDPREADVFGTPDDREADMFGAGPEPSPAAGPAEASPFLGEVDITRTSEADMAARLGANDSVLTIGGQLYLRLSAYAMDDAPVQEASLSAPNLLDVFLDARPNDRVRAYTQARLTHDYTVTDGETDFFGTPVERSRVTLDQLWIKGDLGRRVFVTAGQQRIKWGTGRFWNPSDFLNPDTYNPLSTFDERTGVPLLKLHLPLDVVNLYTVATFSDAVDLGHTGGAARAEILVGNTELALSGKVQKDQPLGLGADLSTGFWLIDVHVEGALRHGVTTPRYSGELNFETFTFPKSRSQEDDWIPHVVAGAEIGIRYNSEDILYLGAEYFYNGMGYDDPAIYPALQLNFDALTSGVELTPENLANDAFQPFYLGRHYGSAYALLSAPGQLDDTSFTASVLTNLSDRTAAARLDVRQTVLTWLALNAYVQAYFGEYGEFRYGLEVPAVPFVEGLEDGITVVPGRGMVGIGAQVSF